MAIFEVMEVTPELRRMIHRAAPSHELREKLREQGSLELRAEGVRLASEGKTTLEEVLRVTHNEDQMRPGQADGKARSAKSAASGRKRDVA